MCGRTFNTKSNFQVHERIHTGAKPFKCFFCPKSFNSSSNRREHHRRHTQQKIYKCKQDGCGKDYHRYHQLVAHTLNVHGIVMDRKTDFGGRAKYDKMEPNASEYSYEPVQPDRVSKPIFKISKKRQINELGEMESLENSVEIKGKTILTKTRFNFATEKFMMRKKDKQGETHQNQEKKGNAWSDIGDPLDIDSMIDEPFVFDDDKEINHQLLDKEKDDQGTIHSSD